MSTDRTGESPVISVRDLRMQYGDKTVLDGLAFDIAPGGVTALLGPNGAGKTTTVEILEGFRQPSAGKAEVLGTDPLKGGDAWRARIGMVLQNWNDHGKWKVRETLSWFSDFYRPFTQPWDLDELLDIVGLTEHAGQRVGRLSGGQRRRLDVAAGVVGRPALLFLDEPTTGFDPRAKRDFHDLVHRIADMEGTTVLLTTHDLDEAAKLADRILILAGGNLIADDSPDALARSVSDTSEIRWRENGVLQVHSSDDATAFVRKLLADEHADVRDLEVSRATLEDAYVSLVEAFEAGRADEAVTAFQEVTR
ncbi:ABC transporter ATP-binding protein [Salininema proteolyticum]|uniref:ABC transporter ATP-binding protein n=1 Tax=Salininema proteolyticum TaxID=1607685 RepID=A0ABV8TT22_9ACTN